MTRATTNAIRIGIWTLAASCLLGLPAAAEKPDGWLGVMIEGPIAVGDADAGGRLGVRIGRVFEDSPAAAAGLRARDVVLEVGGRPVSSARELALAIREQGARAWVPVAIDRDGHPRDLRVRLGERPEDTSPKRLRRGRVGLDAIDLPPALREHFGADADRGAMISRIQIGSPAEAAGLELGDVVVEVAGEPVRSASALNRAIQGAGVGNTVELLVMRDGVELVIEPLVERHEDGVHTR